MKEFNDETGKYWLYLTYKCDWSCPYCIVDTHNHLPADFEKIKKEIDNIPDWSTVVIAGGEPGLTNADDMEYTIKTLCEKNCYIIVATNGLFFKKFKEYDKYITKYYYHVSERFDINDIIDETYKHKSEYMLIITDDNMKDMETFVQKYKDLKFLFRGARSIKFDKSENSLSKINGLKILKKYKDQISKSDVKYLFDRECY